MKTMEFDPWKYLPYDYYPWPNIINPHVERMRKDMENWIDTDYTELTEKAREKYKRMQLHFCTARMLPTMSYEKIIPCNRYMLLYVEIDDQLENASFEEIERMRDRIMGVFRGDIPALEYSDGLERQTAYMRDEYRAFMPRNWVDWFADEWEYSFTYGIGVEVSYKKANKPPFMKLYKVLREYSVLMYPYMTWTDMETGIILPEHIRRHPVIMRLKQLMARMVFIQNDIHSLPKELAKGSEVFNIVLCMRAEYGISMDEAAIRAVRMHDTYLNEFRELIGTLPDLGMPGESLTRYFNCMGIMLQGVNSFYCKDTMRYLPEGKGFAWPEQKKSE